MESAQEAAGKESSVSETLKIDGKTYWVKPLIWQERYVIDIPVQHYGPYQCWPDQWACLPKGFGTVQIILESPDMAAMRAACEAHYEGEVLKLLEEVAAQGDTPSVEVSGEGE